MAYLIGWCILWRYCPTGKYWHLWNKIIESPWLYCQYWGVPQSRKQRSWSLIISVCSTDFSEQEAIRSIFRRYVLANPFINSQTESIIHISRNFNLVTIFKLNLYPSKLRSIDANFELFHDHIHYISFRIITKLNIVR